MKEKKLDEVPDKVTCVLWRCYFQKSREEAQKQKEARNEPR